MALTLIGSQGAAATSVTIPTHQVGDTIIIFAYRDGSATIPTKPAASGTVPAWVDIDAANGANTNSSRSAYFVATATDTTSGTWTNATGIIAVVVRGDSFIGGHVEAGSTATNSATAPAIDVTHSDGTSILLHFYGHRTATAWDAAPTGYTRRVTVDTEVALNTKDSTTTDGAIEQTLTATSSGYRAQTIEIREDRGSPYFQALGTEVGATTGTLTVDWPTHQAGDIGLLFVESQATPSALSTANGFTQLGSDVVATDTTLQVYWARATSSSMAAPIKAADDNHQVGVILTYRNCVSTGNPFTTSATATKDVASTTDTAPAVTTTKVHQLVVVGITKQLDSAAAFASAQTNTNLREITERFDAGTALGNGGGISVMDGLKESAGDTGTTSITVTSSTSAMMTIALAGTGLSPSVTLNSPADASSDSDTTPTLDFTGTDFETNDIRYNVQIADNSGFLDGDTIDSYSESNVDTYWNMSSATVGGAGQKITGDGRELNTAQFYLDKVGSPTGNMVAKLYADGSLPGGTLHATSDNVAASSVSAAGLITFTFSTPYTPSAATQYWLTVEYGSGDASNYIKVGYDNSTSTHAGEGAVFFGSWSALNADVSFYAKTSDVKVTNSYVSGTDAGFVNPDVGGDTDPFNSGENIQFTVQAGDELAIGTYYWRVRGIDPSGSNTYGEWSSTRSFTITAGGTVVKDIIGGYIPFAR